MTGSCCRRCMPLAERALSRAYALASCMLLVWVCAAAAAPGGLEANFPFSASRLVVDPVRPRIYASITGENEVIVLDLNAMSVARVIPVGSSPVGMALSTDGNTLYVANSGTTTNGVSVIDLNTLQVSGSLPTPLAPSDIAAGPNGQLYMTTAASFLPSRGPIMQINTSGSAEGGFGPWQAGYGGFLVTSPDRNTLYFGDANVDPANLASYDISSGTATVLQQPSFGNSGDNGWDLEINHAGTILYFVSDGVQGRDVNDLSNVISSYRTGPGGDNVAFSPDDTILYTAPGGEKQVLVFNTKTQILTAIFAINGDPARIVIDNTGRYLITSNPDICVYDTGRAPVITSPATAEVGAGAPFTYQLTATNQPTSFDAPSLPTGLEMDTATGLITGTLYTPGVYQAMVTASNAIGVTSGYVSISANPGVGLTVSASPGGTVSGGFPGTLFQRSGSTISLSASASAGYVFKGWTGDAISSANPLNLTVTSPMSIEAEFVPGPPVVTSGSMGALVASFDLGALRFAIDPIRPRLYASLPGSDAVAVIDTSTLTLIKEIPVGRDPVGLAISPNGQSLYVADAGPGVDSSGISVINLSKLLTVRKIVTPEPPCEVAAGLDGRLYYTPDLDFDYGLGISNSPADIVTQLDSATGAIQGQFGGGYIQGDAFLAMSPDKKTLYYGNWDVIPASLMGFDVTTGSAALAQQSNFDAVGSNGSDLEVSHSGKFLAYAVGSGQANYEISEIPSDNLNGSNGYLNTGPYPSSIAFSPNDSLAYTPPETQNRMLVYDTKTFQKVGTFPVPGDIYRLVTDRSGKYLFCTVYDVSQSPVALNVYATGQAALVIKSPASAGTAPGQPFRYHIDADGRVDTYTASGLPPGLTIDAATGLITGTATAPGTYEVVIGAHGPTGVGMSTLTITVGEKLVVSVDGNGHVTDGLLGATFQPVGSSMEITATAQEGSVFAGWSGDLNSQAASIAFAINGDIDLQANFVPWASCAGRYSGIFTADPAANAGAGSLTIDIGALGEFTGDINFGGIGYPIKGAFPANRTVQIESVRRGFPTLTGTLYLDLLDTAPTISGTVECGGVTARTSAELSPLNSWKETAFRAGLYSIAMYSSPQSKVVPAGTGYATMTVAPDGLARLVGELADHTAFTASGAIWPTGELPLYEALYGRQGSVSGVLHFQSASKVGELDGVMNWFKPTTLGGSLFPDQFSTALTVVGSSYEPPSSRADRQGAISFEYGNIGPTITQPFEWTSSGIIKIGSPNPNSVTFRVNRATGTFSGTFVAVGKTRAFNGVLLQQQSAGAGVFADSSGSGAVSLTLAP